MICPWVASRVDFKYRFWGRTPGWWTNSQPSQLQIAHTAKAPETHKLRGTGGGHLSTRDSVSALLRGDGGQEDEVGKERRPTAFTKPFRLLRLAWCIRGVGPHPEGACRTRLRG